MPMRRTKNIHVLIVPVDNAEPYSFRIKTTTIKALIVLGSLLTVHIILGFVFYWEFAEEYSYNKKLLKLNAQLQEDNKRVLALADQFYALEEDYKKVSSLLGIDIEEKSQIGGRAKTIESALPFENLLSVKKSGRKPKLYEKDGRFFLSSKKSKIHRYSENIPTLLPVEGFLTLDFKIEDWFLSKTHTGIDIAAKKGSIIRAAGAGIIIFANWTFDLGNLIIIDHGGGIFSWYGHNQRILKGEKSYVKEGEPIALLGTSGRSSGPHLHFEIWKDGIPIDPKEFILAFQ